MKKHSKKQSGGSLVEYVIVCLAMTTALLFPIEPPVGDGRSAAEMAVDAIKSNYGRYVYALSVPI